MHTCHFNKKAFFANAFVQHLVTQLPLGLHETLQRDVARKKHAHKMATEIMLIKEHAHDTMIKEELGINPEKLKGSAMEVAVYTFCYWCCNTFITINVYFG